MYLFIDHGKNLGAVSKSEMLIVFKSVSDLEYYSDAGILNGNIHILNLFVRYFVTSLKMSGVYVSCIMLPSYNGIMKQFLHLPSICTTWSAALSLVPLAKQTSSHS